MIAHNNPYIDANEAWQDVADAPVALVRRSPRVRPALRDAFAVRWVRWSLVLLVTAVLLRLVALSNVVLVPEEAYYWMYARHLSWGYFDHPPMVAWDIRLGTALFGNTEFGVRVVADALMIGASLLMYRFARAWYDRPTALVAALLLHVLPGYFGFGAIATMDSAVTCYWLLGVVGATTALRGNRSFGWYLWGLGLGATMLSKYTGVFLGVGALAAVLLHRPWRHHLRSPHPYLAALLAAAMFSPVVYWNATHGWASFRFQLVDRFAEQSFGLRHVGAFVLIQIGALTPVPLGILLWRSGRALR